MCKNFYKKFRLMVIVLGIFSLLIAALPVFSDAGDLSLHGLVTDDGGKPVKNAKIKAICNGTKMKTKSDASGYYEFRGLKDGKCKIAVFKENYEQAKAAIKISGGVYEQNFVLHEKGEPIQEYGLGDLGKPSDYEDTVYTFRNPFLAVETSYPSAFDWRDEGAVTPAKSQGSCGSCWAFASVGAFESKIRIQYGEVYDLSEQQLVSCGGEFSYYGCCGGYSDAIKFWYNRGPMAENCTDYDDVSSSCIASLTYSSNVPCSRISACEELPYRVTGYYTVNTSDISEIKASLKSDGPAYFAFEVYSDFWPFWNSYSPGTVYTNTSTSLQGGHAVLLIGWDDRKNAWLCKNSWGESRGPNGDGTLWIAYSGHVRNLNFRMANFNITGTEPEQYTITATSGNNGRITPEGIVYVNEGASQIFAMTPDYGYEVEAVKADGVSAGPQSTYTFKNVAADHTIHVTFKKIYDADTYTITASSGSGGTVKPAGSVEVKKGGMHFVSIIPDYGYEVKDVSIDRVSAGAITSYTFKNVTANHTIHATFQPISDDKDVYTITATSGNNGTISPSGRVEVDTEYSWWAGAASVWFTMNPDYGYEVEDVTVDGISVGPVFFYIFDEVTADHTIHVTFKESWSPPF